jgi:translation initiation factor 2 subunit 3
LIEDLEGGIIGGTIAQGKFAVGEEIEIRPGISAEREGKTVYDPLISEIVSLHAGEKSS